MSALPPKADIAERCADDYNQQLRYDGDAYDHQNVNVSQPRKIAILRHPELAE
jgi:hypothetical protein